MKKLSPREIEIIIFLSQGLSGKEIAKSLGIADITVKRHAFSIKGKLQAKNIPHAITKAISEGIILI